MTPIDPFFEEVCDGTLEENIAEPEWNAPERTLLCIKGTDSTLPSYCFYKGGILHTVYDIRNYQEERIPWDLFQIEEELKEKILIQARYDP